MRATDFNGKLKAHLRFALLYSKRSDHRNVLLRRTEQHGDVRG
jgi:hypothetical protein